MSHKFTHWRYELQLKELIHDVCVVRIDMYYYTSMHVCVVRIDMYYYTYMHGSQHIHMYKCTHYHASSMHVCAYIDHGIYDPI